MNQARAFFGTCPFGENYVYAFGGFQDYNVLNSIEKYDNVADNWQLIYIKLPLPLAKLGACAIDG
jgi:hypothetical protein